MTALRLASGFLELRPNQIYKDEGQLPYVLARELGWSSELVYWVREQLELIEPSDYERWVRKVPVSVSPSRARHTLGFLRHLLHRARDIDVLLVWHLTSESVLNATVYKALNPRGTAVLKLDMDHRALAAFDGSPLLSKRGALRRLFEAAPFDFLTIESQGMYRQLLPFLEAAGHRLHVVPIGIDCSQPLDIDQVLARKENIVLTAGRLGIPQKDNQLLLRAVERLPPSVLGDWQFWLVGSRTPELQFDLEALLARRPDLATHLVLRDFVASREELSALYRRAKVYCLTSRWESFAIVLGEAAYHGCYVMSTDVGVGPEVTDGGKAGTLLRSGDVEGLVKALTEVLAGRVDTARGGRWAHHHSRATYDWPVVARRFASLVDEHRARRTSGRQKGGTHGL